MLSSLDPTLDPKKTTDMKTPDKLNPHLDKICKERFGKPFWDLWQTSGGTLMYDLVTAGYKEALKDERERIIEAMKEEIVIIKAIISVKPIDNFSKRIQTANLRFYNKFISIIENT